MGCLGKLKECWSLNETRVSLVYGKFRVQNNRVISVCENMCLRSKDNRDSR